MDYTETSLDEGVVSEVEELKAIQERASITWVDVQGLGDMQILSRVGSIFSLHELLLADVVNVPQRPKLESYEDKLLLITRMVQLREPREFHREQVSIVIGRNYVLTFQEQYGDTLDPVRVRLRAGKGLIRKAQADYLGYAILDTIFDGYFPVLERIGDELETLEELVLADPKPATLRKINQVKNMLIVLRRLVWPQRDALNRLIRDPHPIVKKGTLPYFRDTFDQCAQAVELLEALRELAGGLQNTYLSAAGNRMNEIMKVLTIMASIFIPLTFLAGVYGMNFEAMPELKLQWFYPLLITVMVVIAVGMVGFFWKKGWIGFTSESDGE